MPLQIDSHDELDTVWGDVDRIYYWIKNSDLQGRSWKLTWLILQCG